MNILNRTILCVAVTSIALGTVSAESDEVAEEPRTARALLESIMESHNLPGLGAVVTDKNGILVLEVLGEKIEGGGASLESEDPFHIGSVAKTITATVIARLVEADQLSWDTPVAEVLPEATQNANPAYKGVTLAHLLSHEAGFQPIEEEAELEKIPTLMGDIRSQRLQFASWVMQKESIVEPMTEYRYSNAHFVVAAAMAERVSGKSWEELVDTYVFAELGMSSSGFGWAGKEGEDVPWGHRMVDGSLQPIDPNGDYKLPSFFAPAGDIHASLPDMANYAQAYLSAWNGPGNYLSKATLEQVWTRRIRSGLGWGTTAAFDYELVAMYTGSADTFFMVIVLIPEADLGFVVTANAFNEEAEQAVVKTLRGLVGIYAAKEKTGELAGNKSAG